MGVPDHPMDMQPARVEAALADAPSQSGATAVPHARSTAGLRTQSPDAFGECDRSGVDPLRAGHLPGSDPPRSRFSVLGFAAAGQHPRFGARPGGGGRVQPRQGAVREGGGTRPSSSNPSRAEPGQRSASCSSFGPSTARDRALGRPVAAHGVTCGQGGEASRWGACFVRGTARLRAGASLSLSLHWAGKGEPHRGSARKVTLKSLH